MRKLIVTSCLINALVFAENDIARPEESLFSYLEWKEIYSTRRCVEDYIMLKNGTKLCGHITTLPSLKYSFGKIEFDIPDIALISLLSHGKASKVQYVTRDGLNYVGTLGEGKITIQMTHQDENGHSRDILKDVDPSIISFILLKERRQKILPSNPRLSSIEFKNGDQLPAHILTDPIVITDGRKDKKIKTDSILDLKFNGGLHGFIRDGDKRVSTGFNFVKEQHISAQIPRHAYTIKLPWEHIEGIQGFNGGFSRDTTRPFSILSARIHDELDDALKANLPSSEEDEIGSSWGANLSEGSGALVLAEDAFEGLDELGKGLLTDVDPLFDQNEELAFAEEIAFEPHDTEFSEGVHQIAETALFENLESEASDPETFVFNDATEDTAEELDAAISSLSPEALAFVEGILAQEDEIQDLEEVTRQDDEVLSEKTREFLGKILEKYDEEDEFFAIQDDMKPADKKYENTVEVAEETLRNVPLSIQCPSSSAIVPTKKQPTRYVKAPTFNIDTKPVSNQEYAKFIEETGYPHPIHWVNGIIPKGIEGDPVVNVSYEDAEAYAEWAGKRLPTELEVRRALKNYAIEPLGEHGEWTSSLDEDEIDTRLVMVDLNAVPIEDNFIDHQLTFRTVAD